MTSEIARLEDCVPSYWFLERGITGTDLTLIYNSHATPEQAAESTSYVETDSVVFLEGYSIEPGAKRMYEDDINLFNSIRFKYGKDSQYYQIIKQTFLDHIDQVAYQPSGPTDFTLHTLCSIKELIQKDCIIYYADFRDISNQGAFEQTYERYNSLFRDTSHYMGVVASPDNASSASIVKSIIAIEDRVLGKFVAHGMREMAAAHEVLWQMGIIQNVDMLGRVRRTQEGKISAYVLYGTAHAKSLTWQFTSKGMEPKVIEVHTLQEHEYLDAAQNSDYDNIPRRIGHAAISSLSYEFLDFDNAQKIICDTYSNLEYLNAEDQEELHKFLITCALALREINKDEYAAFNQYLSILRSFMPNPQDFIPV